VCHDDVDTARYADRPRFTRDTAPRPLDRIHANRIRGPHSNANPTAPLSRPSNRAKSKTTKTTSGPALTTKVNVSGAWPRPQTFGLGGSPTARQLLPRLSWSPIVPYNYNRWLDGLWRAQRIFRLSLPRAIFPRKHRVRCLPRNEPASLLWLTILIGRPPRYTVLGKWQARVDLADITRVGCPRY